MEFVEVRAGWFWMGSDNGPRGERPRHPVWADGFAIARAPVTNRDYAQMVEAGDAPPTPWSADPRFSDPDQPVVGVSWLEAVRFCRWLSRRDGARYRLPSEAEWEKAARGELDGLRFPWGDEHPASGRFAAPPRPEDTPANPIGLVGLSGVCHEWCLDWEDATYYGASPARNPRGPETGTRRISRGGAWRHHDPWSPVAHRSSLPPGLRYSDYGFRVLRELD